MSSETIDRLSASVENFKGTVEALKQINAISDKTKEAAEKILASSNELVEKLDTVNTASDSISGSAEEFRNDVIAFRVEMADFSKKLDDDTEELIGKLNEYTRSVQAALDEIRIGNSDNYREIRNKIDDSTKSTDYRLKEAENAVSVMKQQCAKDHGAITACLICSVIAAVVSLIGFFI